MPRGTRKTYIKKKNTRNKKNIRKQRRTCGGGRMGIPNIFNLKTKKKALDYQTKVAN